MTRTTRRWWVSAGTFFSALQLAGTVLAGYVAWNVHEAENRATVAGRLSLMEVEIAARKAYDEHHEALTAPLINEHRQMAHDWPRALALLEEMHLFLVRQYHMPTAHPGPPRMATPEPRVGIIAGEWPDPEGDDGE